MLLVSCTANTLYRKFKTNISRNENAWPRSQIPHSCISQRFIHSHDRSAYFAAKYVGRSWEYINRSQIHECVNCEREGAVSFLEIDKSDLVCTVYIGELQISVKFKFGVDFGLKDFRNSFYHCPSRLSCRSHSNTAQPFKSALVWDFRSLGFSWFYTIKSLCVGETNTKFFKWFLVCSIKDRNFEHFTSSREHHGNMLSSISNFLKKQIFFNSAWRNVALILKTIGSRYSPFLTDRKGTVSTLIPSTLISPFNIVYLGFSLWLKGPMHDRISVELLDNAFAYRIIVSSNLVSTRCTLTFQRNKKYIYSLHILPLLD